jgi:glycosyltransferase involved in cell wall biosynthesis
MGLHNVRFFGQVAQSEIPRFYAALDLAVIHLRPDPVFHTVIPSKLFELMSMQVPVVMAAEGEAADLVNRCGCGCCVPPAQPALLARTIAELSGQPAAMRLMGERGRRWVREHGDRKDKARAALDSLVVAAAPPTTVRTAPAHPASPRRAA